MARLISPTGRPIVLQAVRPNIGVEVAFRGQLDAMISEMQDDIAARTLHLYQANRPRLARDSSPAIDLRDLMRDLARKWQPRFDKLAPDMAEHFSRAAKDRVDGAMSAMLKRAGFTVDFKISATVNDVFQASVAEQVGLIKSIASQHLTEVEGMVMRSVQAGRDIGTLTSELTRRYDLTKHRAAFIARDQNNKATATITRARQEELGLTQARWLHSAGGRKPRPSHVAYSGKLYDVTKGALIDGEYIWPGQLPNCRCVSIAIIPGFDS